MLLKELLPIEIFYRVRSGEQPQSEDYAIHFKNLDPAWLDSLITQQIASFEARREPSRGITTHDGSSTCQAEFSAAKLPTDGLVPPGYEIIRELGRGGMGVVYQARQTELGRLVAIKMIPAGDLALATEIARFRREAAAIAQLNDPHIVQLFEIGVVQGKPYLVMEFVPGGSLSELLRKTLPPPRVAAQLVAILGRSMQEVHQRNIVHRDLKPANILIAGDPSELSNDTPNWSRPLKPKISDFGLAKTTTETCGLTMSGGVLGTPSYMSPEQARGDAHVGPATDVYGLGAILYELLTGRPPFKSFQVASTLKQVLEQQPVAPRQLQPQIPVDLNTICLKCLEKSPLLRSAEARLLADDLDRYLRHEPIHARATSLVVRVVRWCQRHPAQAATAGLTLVTAISLAFVAVVYPFALSQARSATAMRAEQQKTAEALQQVSALRREAENLSASLAINQGQALCESDNAARGMLWLARGLELLPDEHSALALATRKNIAAWREQLHILKQVRTLPRESMAMAMNRTGDQVAIVGYDRQLHLFDTKHGEPIGASMPLPQVASTVAFTNDGKLIACGDLNGTITLWSVSTHKQLRSWKAHAEQIYDMAFADSDQRLVSAGRDSVVHFWNPHDATHIGQPLVHSGPVVCLAISPDGHQLLTGGLDGFLRRWSFATGEAVSDPIPHPSGVIAVACSHDGRTYALGRIDGTVQLFDFASDQPRGKPFEHRSRIRSVEFSTGDRWLLTSSRDATARLWDITSGRPIGAPLEHRDELCAALLTPDSKTIVTTAEDRTLRLWTVAQSTDFDSPAQDRAETPQFPTRSEPAWSSRQFFGMRWRHLDTQLVGFSPSGRLAYGVAAGALELGKSRAIQLYDATSGEKLGSPLAHNAILIDIAFSPDESQIATVSRAGTVHLWNTGSPEQQTSRVLSTRGAKSAAFHPHNQTLMTVGRSGIEFWNGSDGRRTLPAVTVKGPQCAFFDNSGNRLALVHSGGNVDIFDSHTSQIIGTCLNEADAGVSSASFSSDGKSLLVSNWDGIARLWHLDASDSKPIALTHHEPVWAAQFSPDGRIVAAATAAGNVHLWNADTGTAITTPFQQSEYIDDLAFSPDSRMLVLGTYENKVRLVDVFTGRPIGPIQWSSSPVQHVHFAGGGQYFVSGDQTPILRAFKNPRGQVGSVPEIRAELECLCGLRLDEDGIIRCLSAQEWKPRQTQQ